MPKCYAYIRVSTERQAGEVFTSLADQRAAIESLALRLGVTVDEWFTDAGASGATAERRPEFMRMLAVCQAHQRPARDSGFILVLNDSRFGRFGDVDEAAHWRVTFRKLGWRVRFCESDDVADGMARAFVRLASSAQASEYLRNLRANATRGSRGAAGQGYWVSSAPFGYRRAVVHPAGRERVLPNGTPKAKDEKVRLSVHPAEAEIVREAFDRYLRADGTLASVFEWIALRAPRCKWSITAVRWMLGNVAYVGDVVIGRRMSDEDDPGRQVARRTGERWGMDDAHEAIVSRAQFAKVQAKLKINKGAPRRARSDYALSGILRCSDCGGPYVGAGSKHGVSIYRCKASVTGACGGGGVAKHLIEPAVIDTLSSLLSSPSMQRRIREQTERMLDAYAKPADEVGLVETEADFIAQRDRLTLAIAQGTVSTEEASWALNNIRAELARIAGAREHHRIAASRAKAVLADREAIVRHVLDIATRMKAATGSQVRELVTLWCQSLTYNRSARRVRMEVRTAAPFGDNGNGASSSKQVDRACSKRAVVVRDVALPRRTRRSA